MNIRKPTHPGIVLFEDFCKPLGINAEDLSDILNIPNSNYIESLFNGEVSFNSELAVMIGLITKSSAESWMNMQTAHYLWHAKNKVKDLMESGEWFPLVLQDLKL